MANRGTIRQDIKDLVGRNFTGIDTIIDKLINSTVELFGSTITSVYDESQWEHTFTQSEINAKTDNWQLPARTKHFLNAGVIDSSGSEKVYFKLNIVSPLDWYDISKLEGFETGSLSPFDYTVDPVTFRVGRESITSRIDYSGIPKFITRIGNNVHVFPRPSSNEVGFTLRVLLAVKPSILTTDTDTNTIVDNYPDAIVYYAGALLWLLHLHDSIRGSQWLQIATVYLRSFATEEEVKKLLSITTKMV